MPGDMNTEPAPTEDTACVELIGTAKRATTAEPKALETWADNEDGRGLYALLQNNVTCQGASTQSCHYRHKMTRASICMGATWHHEST
jgi:hypothetical protein